MDNKSGEEPGTTLAAHETITLPAQKASKVGQGAEKPSLQVDPPKGSLPGSRQEQRSPVSPFQSQLSVFSGAGSGLNPLLQKMRGAQDRRHQSVAPKHVLAAEGRSLYYSPSHAKLGVVDRIFADKGSLEEQNRANSALRPGGHPATSRFGGKGYPNIFSTRTLHGKQLDDSPTANRSMAGPSPLDAVSAGPQEAFVRQEIFLQKITSEKRNMAAQKRFANSGFGKEHGHKYFVRKID